MNTKERFIAALEHQKTDRLPVTTHHLMQSFLNNHMNGATNIEFFEHIGLDAIDWQIVYKLILNLANISIQSIPKWDF